MFKLLAFLTVSLMAASANAEIFYCNFSEPTITIALNTETGAVKWTDAYRSEFSTQVERVVVSEHAVGASFWRDDQYYQIALDLTTWGSVKGSTYIYPVYGELLDYWVDSLGMYHSLVGGCYSAERPRMCNFASCH